MASLLNGGAEFRVAVVGSGPAGFYAAGQLLSDPTRSISVDIFDRLPTPWGLVRSGVAPDHPKLKMVSAVFEKTASRPGFRFFGNVRVGIRRHESRPAAPLPRRRLRHRCRERPQARDSRGALARQPLGAAVRRMVQRAPRFQRGALRPLLCARAVVVGNGNVALDLARMLSLSREELACTDIADHALERLAESAVRETIVVGRRGPAQASFTSPELNEFALLKSIHVEVHEPSVLKFSADPASAGSEELRRLELLRQFANAGGGRSGDCRSVQFRFLSSPVAILGEGKVEEIVLERNELYLDDSATFRPRPTGELVTVATGLVLRAVGYGGSELTGVPFDAAQGVIAHREGRVVAPSGNPSAGEYCVGWVKRGPTGVIGTNKRDALETVTALLADLDAGVGNVPVEPCPDAIVDLLISRGVQVVDQECWQRIDSHERDRGEAASRPRVKASRWHELLALAGRQGDRLPR